MQPSIVSYNVLKMLMLDGKSNQVAIWFVFGTRLTPAMLASYAFWFARTYPGTSLKSAVLNIGGVDQGEG